MHSTIVVIKVTFVAIFSCYITKVRGSICALVELQNKCKGAQKKLTTGGRQIDDQE